MQLRHQHIQQNQVDGFGPCHSEGFLSIRGGEHPPATLAKAHSTGETGKPVVFEDLLCLRRHWSFSGSGSAKWKVVPFPALDEFGTSVFPHSVFWRLRRPR
jgi:hypothetical protein